MHVPRALAPAAGSFASSWRGACGPDSYRRRSVRTRASRATSSAMDSTSARGTPPHSRRDPPPAILSNEPGTWAHDTVSRRLRENILSRVFSDNAAMLAKDPAAEAALRALDTELSDAANATIRAIRPDGGPDVHAWNETLAAPWIGTSWLDTPWLASEFYFYRRILEALGYFGDGPCAQMDPFQRDKDAGLEACVGAVGALAPRLNEYASAPGVNGVLEGAASSSSSPSGATAWTSASGPRGAAAAGDDGESSSSARAADAFNEALTAGERCLLHDDSAAAAAALLEPGRDRVGLVVDNAGFELVCDLALADALVCARDRTNADADANDVAARVTVTLHVKAHPVFVSDAMEKDVRATVDAMCASDDDEVARMGRRWRGHPTSGAWVITPQFAWSQPQPFWELPEDARASLAAESAGSSRATRIIVVCWAIVSGISTRRSRTWRRTSRRRCWPCARSRRSSGAGFRRSRRRGRRPRTRRGG